MAMFSVRIRNMMELEKMVTASPQATVADAARLMAGGGVGAVMVVDDEALTGIFTERDAVFRVIAAGLDARTTRLAEVMTPSPLSVDPERSFGYALQLMHEHGFRHVPVVENGKPIGIVSARDALDPEMEDFICEAQRREGIR
jgi:CBS domain-containing protein